MHQFKSTAFYRNDKSDWSLGTWINCTNLVYIFLNVDRKCPIYFKISTCSNMPCIQNILWNYVLLSAQVLFCIINKTQCEKICKIVLNHNIGLVKNRLSSFVLQTCGIPQHINTKIGQYFIFCTNKYLPHLFVKQQSYLSICYYRAAFNAER